MLTPVVSVCIPVYNGERYLAETIRSVLAQTCPDFELVVLDNASTDRTADVVRSFCDPRIRYELNTTTVAVGDNWNRAVQLSAAPLVKVVCADDLLHPRCLELQVDALQSNARLSVIAARRHMLDEQSRIIAPGRGLRGLIGLRSAAEVARRVVRSGVNPIGESSGVLFRREHFDAAGGWCGERQFVMDLDMWMRLLQFGEFYGLNDTLASFRVHGRSVSSANDRGMVEEQRTLIDELARASLYGARRSDRVVGWMGARLGRGRRKLLFAASRLTSRIRRPGRCSPEPH